MTLAELAARLGPRRMQSGGVPAWTRGCFRRRSITYFTGESDTTTDVFWLQSRGLTADLRLPAVRPGLRGPIETAPPETLLALADFEGGMARTGWDGRLMSWSEWTALQLHDKWPEPGRLTRVGDCLIEFAPSGAYVEDWRLMPSRDGLLVGLRLLEEREVASGIVRHRGGGLVICGQHAALVRGRPQALPPSAGRLDTFVRAHLGDRVALRAAFAFEASYAVGDGETFTVVASTNPARERMPLLALDGFSHDESRDLVVQQSPQEGVMRLFTIDTLEPNVGFGPATTVNAEGAAWLSREQRTLVPAPAPG